jgi:hypothetical protein
LTGFCDDFTLEIAYIFIFLERAAKGLSSIEESIGEKIGKKPANCFMDG